MTLPAPTYDLVLLLDPKAEDETRAKIVADAKSAIEAQGDLLRHDDWGERPLAYPIDKKASAEYHLLQFHAGTPELLSGLDRTLRITDGVVRFRIIKLKPGVPDAPDMPAASAPPVEAPAPADTPAAEQPEPASSAPAEPAGAVETPRAAASQAVAEAAGPSAEGADAPDAAAPQPA